MNQNVAKYEAPTSALTAYAPEQVNALRKWVAPNFNDAELELALSYCRAINVDPFGRELYFWKDTRGRMVMYPGISLRRRRAAESREYQGRTQFEYFDAKTETWKQGPWLSNTPPAAVRVGVWRRGFREPLFGISILAKDRKNTPGPWQDDTVHMMEVAAERRALDGAFPQESRQAARELEMLARDEGFEISDEPDPGEYVETVAEHPGNLRTFPAMDDGADEPPYQPIAPIEEHEFHATVTFENEPSELSKRINPITLTNDATGETMVVEPEPAAARHDDVLAKARAKLAPKTQPDPLTAQLEPEITPIKALFKKVKAWAEQHGTDPNRLRYYMATASGVPQAVSEAAVKEWLTARPENTLDRLFELYVAGESGQDGAEAAAAEQGALI